MRKYHVYIITNYSNTIFYIGVTSNIARRVFEHKEGTVKGFSSKYKLKKLVYAEVFKSVNEALAREKQLKNWHREWKINLIKSINPKFDELEL